MAVNPSQLIQMSRLNGIKNFLQNQQAQNTIAATARKFVPSSGSGSQQAVDSGLRDTGGRSIPHGNTPMVPDAGLFNTPVPLPTQPGPPDPTIEPTPIPDVGGGPPLEGPTPGGPQGGPQAGPISGGTWPQGVLPNGPITSFGYNPPSGNAPPTAVPTFWGPGRGNTPVEGTAVAANNNVWSPYNVPLSKTPGGHNANWWVI
jgi:hypothetical protein